MDAQEKNSPVSPDTQANPAPLLDPKGAARRRFTRAGTGAAGVILTLQSQPAMATYGKCVSPSGFVSATTGTSLNPLRLCSNNEDPSYWADNPRQWSSRAFTDRTALFGAHFKCPRGYGTLAKMSLYDVLCRKSTVVTSADPSGISRLCIAAWLNARMNHNNVLSPDRAVEIWNQYASTGQFAPERTATAWQRSYIFSYLRSTFRTHGY